MAKARRRKKSGKAGPSVLKQALLLVLAVSLFAAALYGLLLVDAGEPGPEVPSNDAPPVDHIDDSSRDRLREILREEGGE